MPVSFLLFLNHLVFVTLYMQVCYTIKCQIDGSLVKVYFFRVCWFQVLDAYFYSLSLFFLLLFFFFFFLVYYQRGFVEALARNIWPKARVARIFCYGLTHLCQTHCSSAISNLKFLLFMLLCKVLTTQVLTCNLV